MNRFLISVRTLRAWLQRRWHRLLAGDQATRMFRGIQRRLILWYCGVLTVLLLLAGTLLLFGMQNELFAPVQTYLTESAEILSKGWQADHIAPCVEGHTNVVPYVACYDDDGSLLGMSGPAREAPGFLSSMLAKNALAGTPAMATIDGGNGLGTLSCYALPVLDPATGQVLGVVQVGISIEGQTQALATLRTLLVLVGLGTIGGAGIGGFFLARRALAPAHLAYARQQTFIADAAHELRTPLTLLRADAEVLLLDRAQVPPQDASILDNIITETEHLATLTTQFLTLARLDSGTMPIAHDVVDVRDLIEHVMQRTRAYAAEQQVHIRQQARSGPLLVVGEAALLEQALLILVDNAIKYNVPNGEVNLRTTVHDGQICIIVQDTGMGIAPEHLAQLGERFYRPDRARARATGGTGLGLSIARGIAAAHQGTLSLESPDQKGAIATLRLPKATIPIA